MRTTRPMSEDGGVPVDGRLDLDTSKVQALQPLDESAYAGVDVDHLMVFAMRRLEDIGADLSFENAVVAVFRLFPRKFSLLGYPAYPDSNRVSKCLWRLTSDKKRMWLAGRVRQGFSITERGRRFVEAAELQLAGRSLKKSRATSQTRRKEVLLREVVASSAYTKYKAGQEDSITSADLCFLLQGTLESSKESLRSNLATLREYAAELQHPEVVEFLDRMNLRFRSFLGERRGKGA